MGAALVLGLSESENRLELAGPAAAALGGNPESRIEAATPGRIVLRCRFFGPDVAPLPAYGKNVLIEGGTGMVVLRSALNDTPGGYTLRATDVVTGAAATARTRLI